MAAVPFKVKNGIDQVLKDPRSGDGSILGDVADQENRDAAAFSHHHKSAGRLAYLADASGRRFQRRGEDGLDRIDNQSLRLEVLHLNEDFFQGSFCEDVKTLGIYPHSGAAEFYLAGRLLGGNIEYASRRFCKMVGCLQKQG